MLFSLGQFPPFDQTVLQDEARGDLSVIAGIAVALFAVATVRYWLIYRRRRAVVLISVLTTWSLLAEAAAATAIGRPWQLSWWLWHVLLVLAFAFVAYTADVQYRREGTAGSLFRGVALEETIIAARADYEHALEQLVAVMRERQPDERQVTRLTAAVARPVRPHRSATGGARRAALALERERETTNQLSGLVEVSRAMTVLDDEGTLLDRAATELDARFQPRPDLARAAPRRPAPARRRRAFLDRDLRARGRRNRAARARRA